MDKGEFPSIITYPSSMTTPDIPGDEPMYLTGPEIREILSIYGLGFKPATIGATIALCESPGDTNPVGEPTADFNLVRSYTDESSYMGGFQILSEPGHLETGLPRDATQLLDPMFNCETAVGLRKLYGWGYWRSYETELFNEYYEALIAYKPAAIATVHSIQPGELIQLGFIGNDQPKE